MKATGKLLGAILDLGREMMVTGAEVWRVKGLLVRMFDAYCFKEWEVWIVASFMAASVHTWDDREYTEIRTIEDRSYDLDKLERLYSLAEEMIRSPVSVNTMRMKVDEVLERPGQPEIQKYAAAVMAGVGFAVFYSGGLPEALVVAVMSVVFMFYSRRMGSVIDTRLAFNAAGAFVMETIALTAAACGIGSDIAAVTTAAILLLASGIGFARGIGDFIHGDTLAGVGETSNALLGAAGIAIGIYISMLFFTSFLRQDIFVENTVNRIADPAIQLISCTIGCAGFALMFGARRRALPFSVIGSFLTWTVFLVAVNRFSCTSFTATLLSSCFVALYAGAVNAVTKIPSAIFLTSCVFPLLPGSSLYYAVYGLVCENMDMFRSHGRAMLLTSIGIALGFIIVNNLIHIIRRVFFSEAS